MRVVGLRGRSRVKVSRDVVGFARIGRSNVQVSLKRVSPPLRQFCDVTIWNQNVAWREDIVPLQAADTKSRSQVADWAIRIILWAEVILVVNLFSLGQRFL